jgi:RNAse (barnase) inhibitor barstar
MNGWLLVDDDEAPVAECAEIDGLFAALPPRPRERFTLIGCEPEDALAGRLGNVWLTPAGAEPGDLGEYLCGLVVGERRPSQVVPGTVDIDLDGFVHVYDRTDAVPDRPPGGTYHLDGRFVTDVEGFYCAIGEAINGPGGYFGWNLDALDDCLSGGFGVHPPFRLAWHDSAVAREHLVDGYDHRRMEPAVTFDYLIDLLTSNGVEVDQR